MKKLAFFILLSLVTLGVSAQSNLKWNVNAGIGMSNWYGDDTDGIIGLSLYIRSTVPPAGSVCRNHFTTGKRKTIFILFYTIQMNGETFAPVKEPGSLDSDMVYFHCGKITLGRPPSPCRHTYEQ